VTKVDPNMIIKKKNGRDQEVQDGWIGHIIPFDLVQKTLLTDRCKALDSKQNRLSEISSSYDELLESLSEEDKSSPVINDAGDTFISAEIKKEAKHLRGTHAEEGTIEAAILKVNKLLSEEKKLKSEIKADKAKLHEDTKKTIEGLSDDEAKTMLRLKWIRPIMDGIFALPSTVTEDAVTKINDLASKYSVTYSSVIDDIASAETSLSGMIDDLVGNEYDMRGLEEFKSLLGGE
jgi:type I restriction enzyme M protein